MSLVIVVLLECVIWNKVLSNQPHDDVVQVKGGLIRAYWVQDRSIIKYSGIDIVGIEYTPALIPSQKLVGEWLFFLRRLYLFLFAFLAHWALQYLFLLSNVVKTFPQIEHFF